MKYKGFILWVICKLLVLVLLLVCLLLFVANFYFVKDGSMFPNIHQSDVCVIYKLGSVQIDDVVLYHTDDGNRLGRIVGIAGQTIDFPETGGYLVNDYLPSEEITYLTFKASDSDVVYPLVIDSNSYFILNDFREDVKDSRIYGTIKRSEIIGKVLFVLRRLSF